MTNVTENRIGLYDEVNELKAKEDKHFANLRKIKEEKRLAESKLDDANRTIKASEGAWKKEREGWDKEKADLTMAKSGLSWPKSMPRPKFTGYKLILSDYVEAEHGRGETETGRGAG